MKTEVNFKTILVTLGHLVIYTIVCYVISYLAFTIFVHGSTFIAIDFTNLQTNLVGKVSVHRNVLALFFAIGVLSTCLMAIIILTFSRIKPNGGYLSHMGNLLCGNTTRFVGTFLILSLISIMIGKTYPINYTKLEQEVKSTWENESLGLSYKVYVENGELKQLKEVNVPIEVFKSIDKVPQTLELLGMSFEYDSIDYVSKDIINICYVEKE